MKFTLKRLPGENIQSLMRKAGYYFQAKDKKKSELIFVRPLEKSGYPRFHLYLKINQKTQELILNLHLDQKRPIYKEAPAHSADYEGPAIEREAERIKQILK